jgi:hypothetical protein
VPDDWTVETADKAAAVSASLSAARSPDALAKAAAALTRAMLKLERTAEENIRLRKAIDDLTPSLTDMKSASRRLKPSRCRPRPRCAP